MAKQKSIVQFTGTIDGVNFYFRKGVAVARKAGGGFTGAKIKKSPSMSRVRENNSEFANCSRFKKVFKDALFVYYKNYKSSDLHSNMMRTFIAIKDCDLVSERGSRTIKNGLMSVDGAALLCGFPFTDFKFSLLHGVFNSTDCSYTLHGFTVSSVSFPAGATHLLIDYGVMAIDFDKPSACLHQSLTRIALSPNDVFNGVSFSIEDAVTLDTGVGILCYRFVQFLNGAYYSLNDQRYFGLQVVGIKL